MAEIPSGLGASAAQAGFTAKNIANARDAQSAGRTHASNQRTKAIDQAGSSVDTQDGDTQVFSDSEGAGSQGRANEDEQTADHPDEQTPDAPPDVTLDDEGHLHLDLEA